MRFEHLRSYHYDIEARRSKGPRPARSCRPLRCERLEDRRLLSGTVFQPLHGAAALAAGSPAAAAVSQTYGQVPMSFEINQGQSAAVQYLTRGSGYALFLTHDGATLSLQRDRPRRRRGASAAASGTGVALNMQLVGANPQAAVQGEDRLPGVSNYFLGNDPSQWRTGVANYGRVAYQGVYPGVDLVYYGNQRQLE